MDHNIAGELASRENCQVGVFLSYVSGKGHTLIDRELYLPKRWLDDRERCRAAGIPDTVRFQTKCELARAMVERVRAAHIPIAWVVAGIGLWEQFRSAGVAGSPAVFLRAGGGL